MSGFDANGVNGADRIRPSDMQDEGLVASSRRVHWKGKKEGIVFPSRAGSGLSETSCRYPSEKQ